MGEGVEGGEGGEKKRGRIFKVRQISVFAGKLDKRVKMLTNSCIRKLDVAGM